MLEVCECATNECETSCQTIRGSGLFSTWGHHWHRMEDVKGILYMYRERLKSKKPEEQ